MAEVTRVPIKPISKGSLLMLFLGIAIGLAIAGAFAWATAPKGVDVEVVREGTGASPSNAASCTPCVSFLISCVPRVFPWTPCRWA